jgi:hypothetical protein
MAYVAACDADGNAVLTQKEPLLSGDTLGFGAGRKAAVSFSVTYMEDSDGIP